MKEEPLYHHTCPRCVFLGAVRGDEDAYWCDRHQGENVEWFRVEMVVLRTSSEPGYSGFLRSSNWGQLKSNQHPVMTQYREVLARASSRGLVCKSRAMRCLHE